MKHLKEIETGNLLRTSNTEAAAKVESGLFKFIKKAKFKRLLKEHNKQQKRFKIRKAPVFNSGKLRKAEAFLLEKCTTKKDESGADLLYKNGNKQYKKKTSHKRNEQRQAEAKNKKKKR